MNKNNKLFKRSTFYLTMDDEKSVCSCCWAAFTVVIITVIIATLYFWCLQLMAVSHVTNLKHQSLHKIWSLKCNWAKSGQTLTRGSDLARQSDHFRSGFIFDIKLAVHTKGKLIPQSLDRILDRNIGWILIEYETQGALNLVLPVTWWCLASIFLSHLIFIASC